MAAPRLVHERTATRSMTSGTAGHSTAGWQYTFAVRGQVSRTFKTIPFGPSGSRMRKGRLESSSGFRAMMKSSTCPLPRVDSSVDVVEYRDNLDPERVVGRRRSEVSCREREVVGLCREADEAVVHGTANDVPIGKKSVDVCRGGRWHQRGRAEVRVDEPDRVEGRDPCVAREAGEHAERLGQGMLGQHEVQSTQPTTNCSMRYM